jgi:hypothetical protein
MILATKIALSLLAVVTILGCSKDEPTSGGSASASASAVASTALPPPSAMASAPAPAPSAAAPVVPHDCPKGSTGDGTFDKPCEAKGGARLMDVAWTGKTDDKGPFFRVTNKSSLTILYGKLVVYFYDKSGKPLQVQDTAATPPKATPYRVCAGNIFAGVLKPAEKAVVQVSCVKKENVPDGTAAIEAEVQTLGFSDASEKKVDFYWRNNDLVVDARKKGGVK